MYAVVKTLLFSANQKTIHIFGLIVYIYQVMVNLGYQEKVLKMLQMSTAQSSMTRKKYEMTCSSIWLRFPILFCLRYWWNLATFHALFLLNEGRAARRWNFLAIRVAFRPRKHLMGCCSSMHCNMGYILPNISFVNFTLFICQVPLFLFGLLKVSCHVSLTWCHTFQLKGIEPPGFSFQIVNTNMDEFSPRARRRSALLTWQHIASLPPSLPVVYCGGFNTQKE